MKKLIVIVLLFIAGAAFFYFYPQSSAGLMQPDLEQTVTSAVEPESPNSKVQTFASDKLNKLAQTQHECQANQADLSQRIDSIHHDIIKAMEYELRHGRTVREILAYSNQYETFYDGYDDLLLRARMNIEKQKYDFTTTTSVLNEWQGLSVLELFDAEGTTTIINELNRIQSIHLKTGIGLEFTDQVTAEDLYALLENEKFNTYLESPLMAGGSKVLSPSILFVLKATTLNIDDFKKAIATRAFTVNELAIAIKNDLPNEYILPLLAQVSDLANMPVTVQGEYDSYENIADIAVAQFNYELLPILAKRGVTPTNQPGIVTGMDIAIMNLPSARNYLRRNEVFSAKHLQTLRYLAELGYQAHGTLEVHEHETKITFAAPHRRNFHIDEATDPDVMKVLSDIELIDGRFAIEPMTTDQSLLSKALQVAKLQIQQQKDQGRQCESKRIEMMTEEGFVDIKVAFKIIEEIKKDDVNIAGRLHQIDPFLVHLWRNSENSFRKVDLDQESRFIQLLQSEQFQPALEYVLAQPLTSEETDTLLVLTLIGNQFDQLLDIWNSRISPVAPSGLLMFEEIPLALWQQLLDGGFDFSIRDQLGNDIFYAAAMHSTQAVQLLLEHGFSPTTDHFGLDVLDLLLDQSYQQGRLEPAIAPLVQVISPFEPSHYARIARLQKFFPAEYNKLVAFNKQLALTAPTPINQFRFSF